MAFESRFWRSTIKKDIKKLNRKLGVKVDKLSDNEVDKIYSEIEINLFILAYSLRKLIDTNKIPRGISKKKIKLEKYKKNKKSFRPWDNTFYDYYYLNLKSTSCVLDFREVCNQFIHSHFFQPLCNYRSFIRTLAFVSDKQRNQHIYFLNIKYFLNRIAMFIDKQPTKMTVIFNKKENEYFSVYE